ncbi:hypothetical protein [Streptomyces griseorubiginosus]|uniref:hypothetical protein n=1 Tax=Streptomyces griseorubiginosus TaxID=67304 RepID=UPI002E8079D0|nr:hypothetical protein [Streptomyces griseorubiginosus]WUB43994.1 hypothetical protein OHN19_11855 [Streptomyces griseorubiginosus]WUB52512.1 hypothetical protein OG942_11850 [Streptomyces griseorubiginosus]
MTHHVVEILLTRPVTHSELRRASRALPLGANSDGIRLMAIHPAKTPGRALRSVRRRLQHLLPLDILTTHYPDPSGQVILNVEFSPAARQLIGQAAAARGQRPAEYVGHCMAEALRHSEQERARALTAQLEGMLAHHRPEEVLACTARILLHRREPGTPGLGPRDAAESSSPIFTA